MFPEKFTVGVLIGLETDARGISMRKAGRSEVIILDPDLQLAQTLL